MLLEYQRWWNLTPHLGVNVGNAILPTSCRFFRCFRGMMATCKEGGFQDVTRSAFKLNHREVCAIQVDRNGAMMHGQWQVVANILGFPEGKRRGQFQC